MTIEPADGGPYVTEILLDIRSLVGEGGDQCGSKICFALASPDLQIRINKDVVNIRHRVPCHSAVRDEIKQPAPQHAFAHLTDVVKPDIPGPAARPRECVRETPNLEVALKYQNAPLAQLRHDARECESAHAGTDNNRVVFGLRRHVVRHSSSPNCTYRMIASGVWHEFSALKTPHGPIYSQVGQKNTLR